MAMQSLTQSAFVLPTQPSPILSKSSISWDIVNSRKMSTYIAVEGVHKDVVLGLFLLSFLNYPLVI